MVGIGQKLPDTEVLWVRESEVKKINFRQKLAGRRVATLECLALSPQRVQGCISQI